MVRRTSVFVLLVLAAAAGCRHRLAIIPCDEPANGRPSTSAGTAHGTTPGPSGAEFRGPNEIRVQAPAQKVTVMLPPESGGNCAPGGAPPCPPQAAPAPAAAPAAPPMMMMAPAAPAYAAAPMAAPAMMSSEQTVRPRTRVALGFDIIRIPIPCPKLFAVQGEQEVVTRQTYQMPAAAPIVPAPVMAAPVMAAPMMAAAPVAYPAAAPTYVPVPAAAPPAPVFAPPPVYAPPPAYAPPPQPAMICVPGPAPCAPESCPPASCTSGAKPAHNHPILNHLSQMKNKLDGIERDYWKRAAPACTDAPAAPVLHAPRPVEEQ